MRAPRITLYHNMADPLCPMCVDRWERLAAVRGTMGGTNTPMARGHSGPLLAIIAQGLSTTTEGGNLTHNAGVAGSSPAPATQENGAHPLTAHAVTRIARRVVSAIRASWGTTRGTIGSAKAVLRAIGDALATAELRYWQ